MLKNYLLVALRNLRRHKAYSFINVVGLAVGLTCCLVIFQYVAFEYSFDRFHAHERDLYRVLQSTPLVTEPFEGGGDNTGFALAPALDASVPEVLHVARLHPEYDGALVSNPARPELRFEERRMFYTDPSFLQMFTFPLVGGTQQAALEPGTVLLSVSMARKYFGSANPIGQVLDVTGATERGYRVTGVFEDVPPNSHLQFDFLLPMEDLLQTEDYLSEPEGGWSWNNFYTYVQLYPGADPATVERKMTEAYTTYRGEALRQQQRKAQLWAQPLRDIHLNAEIQGWSGLASGSYRTVYFFTLIGLITLVIALVNYVNLATARALDRAPEIGVRKAVGARRKQLIVQFLFESGLTNFVAALLALVAAILLTPLVNNLAGTQLSVAGWLNPLFWLAFFATFCAGTLLAGLYPAFVLSAFQPSSVLKSKGSTASGQLWLRRGLVVLQFAASVVLAVGTAVVYDQLAFMRQMDLGLDLEQVLMVSGPRVLPEGTEPETAMTTFAEELRRLPAVHRVGTSTALPGQAFNWNGASIRRATDSPGSVIRGVATYIDTSFAGVFGLELAAGDGFLEFTPPPDSGDTPFPLIANETAVRTLGYASPSAALGEAIVIGDYDARIVGVFRDFNWSSAHETRQNMFFVRYDGGRHVSLRVGTEDLPVTLAAIEATYSRLFPGNVFGYAFADEAFDELYRNEERFATLFTLFAGLAILIACLGLFGLAAFTTRQRTKEIGVRKVLGASVGSIITLLSKDYALLVLGAFGVAVPIVYLLMERWLEGFAYHVELGVGVFLAAGLLAFTAALLSVSTQALRAAKANPVKALRYE